MIRQDTQTLAHTSILLVDDHPLVREALKLIIGREEDLMVCGEAATRNEVLGLLTRCSPRLVILDLGVGKVDGMGLIQDIRSQSPRTRILVLSMHDELMYAERSVRAGSHGFISKTETPAAILGAIRIVLSGEIYWSVSVMAHIATRLTQEKKPGNGWPVDPLSERELQVYEMIGTGYSTLQISDILHIAASTVETHRARIKGKLNYKNGSELRQNAIHWNMARVTQPFPMATVQHEMPIEHSERLVA